MISQQTIQGNWNEIKSKLRSQWGVLTDDDFLSFNGNVGQLMDTLQRKTGEARESIERFFEQWGSNGAAAFTQASETVRGYANQAAESVQETSQRAVESVREGYAEVEGLVRQRPAESMAVCFGVGMVTGVIVGLLLRGR